MANPRLLQALINRFSKGGADSTKLQGLSEVIPKPATKPVPPRVIDMQTGEPARGTGPTQQMFDEGDPNTFRLLEDIPPGEPRVGNPAPQAPTSNLELSGREAAMSAKAEREAVIGITDFEAEEFFDQFGRLEEAVRKGTKKALGGIKEGEVIDELTLRELRKIAPAQEAAKTTRREGGQAATVFRRTGNPDARPGRRENSAKGAPSINELRDKFTAPLDPDIVARQGNERAFRLLDILRQREAREGISNIPRKK